MLVIFRLSTEKRQPGLFLRNARWWVGVAGKVTLSALVRGRPVHAAFGACRLLGLLTGLLSPAQWVAFLNGKAGTSARSPESKQQAVGR